MTCENFQLYSAVVFLEYSTAQTMASNTNLFVEYFDSYFVSFFDAHENSFHSLFHFSCSKKLNHFSLLMFDTFVMF